MHVKGESGRPCRCKQKLTFFTLHNRMPTGPLIPAALQLPITHDHRIWKGCFRFVVKTQSIKRYTQRFYLLIVAIVSDRSQSLFVFEIAVRVHNMYLCRVESKY